MQWEQEIVDRYYKEKEDKMEKNKDVKISLLRQGIKVLDERIERDIKGYLVSLKNLAAEIDALENEPKVYQSPVKTNIERFPSLEALSKLVTASPGHWITSDKRNLLIRTMPSSHLSSAIEYMRALKEEIIKLENRFDTKEDELKAEVKYRGLL